VLVQTIEVVAVDGDYNGNGIVDAADYVIWRKQQGTAGPQADSTGPGLDGVPDGIVNEHDYSFWAAHYGAGGGSAAAGGLLAVPEPGTVWLLVGSALLMLRQFRSSRMRACRSFSPVVVQR
jgi:hypothetical protein